MDVSITRLNNSFFMVFSCCFYLSLHTSPLKNVTIQQLPILRRLGRFTYPMYASPPKVTAICGTAKQLLFWEVLAISIIELVVSVCPYIEVFTKINSSDTIECIVWFWFEGNIYFFSDNYLLFAFKSAIRDALLLANRKRPESIDLQRRWMPIHNRFWKKSFLAKKAKFFLCHS